VRYELVDCETSGSLFRNALRHSEMYRAHRVGIGESGRLERTGAQDDVHAIAANTRRRIEPLALHRADDGSDRIVSGVCTKSMTMTRPPADLNG
jgi:hypothetical protein